MNNSISEDIMA